MAISNPTLEQQAKSLAESICQQYEKQIYESLMEHAHKEAHNIARRMMQSLIVNARAYYDPMMVLNNFNVNINGVPVEVVEKL